MTPNPWFKPRALVALALLGAALTVSCTSPAPPTERTSRDQPPPDAHAEADPTPAPAASASPEPETVPAPAPKAAGPRPDVRPQLDDARRLMDQGYSHDALDALDEVITLDPACAEAYLLRAEVCEDLEDYEGALASYAHHDGATKGKAVVAETLNTRVRLEGLLELKHHLVDLDAYELAKTALEDVLDETPARANLQRALAEAFLAAGDPTRARLEYGRAIEDHGVTALLLRRRSETNLQLGDPKLALADIDRAIKLSPDAADRFELLTLRGRALGDTGDWAKATACLDQAIQLAPKRAKGYRVRARLRLRAKQFAEATTDLERAVTLAPSHVQSWLDLGAARHSARDSEGALRALARAIDLDPTGASYMKRGQLHAADGRLAAALEDYDEAINSEGAEEAYYWRAIVNEREGETLLAAGDLRLFLQNVTPDHPLASAAKAKLSELK
jgi:tetratricopeptide (TPR) repeat protein